MEAIQINNPKPELGRNLAPEAWNFDVAETSFSTVSGSGSGSLTSKAMSGEFALRVTNSNTSKGDYLTGMNSPQVFIAAQSGYHVFSLFAKNDNQNTEIITGHLRVFKNGLLLNDYDVTNSVKGIWQRFAFAENLSASDTVSIQYGSRENEDSIDTTYVDFDGFQVEYDDRGLGGIPTIFNTL